MAATTAQVPDRILQWLWNALQSDYHNPQATYSDAVSVLSTYPSLQPRTDVYTYNNGQPALLLCLSGTLPVNFRGTVYRFPIKIWVPQAHPRDPEGIMVFVVPGETMMIRPGQHVSIDGRVYHPYLRDWAAGQPSSIAEFLRILQDVFAREPPVIARQQQQQFRHNGSGTHSPAQRPAPPPKERPGSVIQQGPVEMPAGPNPPPKPPKPGEQARGTPVQYQHRETVRDGPPLPPLPHEHQQQGYRSPQAQQRGNGFATPPRQQSLSYASNTNGGPPVPPLPQVAYGRDLQNYPRDSPVSPVSPNGFNSTGRTDRYSHAPPLPQSPIQGPNGQQQAQAPYPGSHSQGKQPQQYQQMPPQQYHRQPYQPQTMQGQQQLYQPPQPQIPSHYQAQQHHPSAQNPQPLQPPPDLLTDPFDVTLPALTSHAAPPIPPNPEKEHLLTILSQSLVAQSSQKIQQNASALPALRAQNQAMQEAHQRLQMELAQLEQLDRVLASNESILRQNMDECDAVIASSKKMPEPAIDDVLVAPTLVQNQLWNLEAEIAGLREAIWVLQRAVSQGRVGGSEFVRVNRALGREMFLKMALGRKIAIGLGLDVSTSGRGIRGGGGGSGGDEGFYS